MVRDASLTISHHLLFLTISYHMVGDSGRWWEIMGDSGRWWEMVRVVGGGESGGRWWEIVGDGEWREVVGNGGRW